MADQVEGSRRYADRFNVAMAEAGYPTAVMVVDENGERYMSPLVAGAPPAVVWQALHLAAGDAAHACWSCWEVAYRDRDRASWASDCATGARGGCHFPEGPSRPPREPLS
jgi:hypothetical protein